MTSGKINVQFTTKACERLRRVKDHGDFKTYQDVIVFCTKLYEELQDIHERGGHVLLKHPEHDQPLIWRVFY